uniref:Peptidase S1 domain-containing protein n=1 Tax=Timema poppense TaxID=170557 RepID=A0A7R9H7Q6_TIMPO|nr:unnamed protein product [Timema poppensis]
MADAFFRLSADVSYPVYIRQAVTDSPNWDGPASALRARYEHATSTLRARYEPFALVRRLLVLPTNTKGFVSLVGTCFLRARKQGELLALEYGGSLFCGSSAIGDYWVLTAGHCLYFFKAEDIKVRAGSLQQNQNGTLHEVAELMYHPKFDMSLDVDNDIGLIKATASRGMLASDAIGCGVRRASRGPPKRHHFKPRVVHRV